MSFYDDSTLMFLAAGAVGKDGKASTVKPAAPNPQAPLYVTRGSNLTATRVDSNGLIEKGRENLLKDSNSFDPSGTAWNPTSAYTLTSGQAGYDGSNDAWLLDKLNTLNDYFQQRSINGMGGNVITESVYAKAGTEVGLMLFNSNGYVHWNLSSGTLISEAGNLITSSIESVGNGWYRCSLTVGGGNSYDRMMIKVVNSTAANSSGSIYIQDAQVELGLVATEYIESGATKGLAGLLENEPRFNYPIGGGSPHLLLEPIRTNLSLYSEALLSYNTFKVIGSEVTLSYSTNTTPEGLNSSVTTVLEGEGTSNHRCYFEDIDPCTIGSTYSFSIFAKSVKGRNIRIGDGGKGFEVDTIVNLSDGSILNDVNNNVSVEDFGNGWYRISAFGTNNSIHSTQRVFINSVDGTTLSFEGDTTKGLLLWGAQFEEGSYPTSYIPNHSGGSVSRESDIYQNTNIDTVTNMSTDECTVFLDVDLPQGRESSQRFLQFTDVAGGGSTYFGLKGNYVPSPIIQLFGGGTINSSNTHALSVGRHKIAIRWLSGTATVFIDGAEVSALSSTDSSAPTSFDKVYGSGAPYRHLVHQLIVLTSGWDDLDCRVLTGLTNYYASFSEMATALNYTIYE